MSNIQKTGIVELNKLSNERKERIWRDLQLGGALQDNFLINGKEFQVLPLDIKALVWNQLLFTEDGDEGDIVFTYKEYDPGAAHYATLDMLKQYYKNNPGLTTEEEYKEAFESAMKTPYGYIYVKQG